MRLWCTSHSRPCMFSKAKCQRRRPCIRRLPQFAPRDMRPYVALGDLYDATKQPDAALTAYTQAATIDPQAITPRRSLADLVLHQNHLDEAPKRTQSAAQHERRQDPGRYYEELVALGRRKSPRLLILREGAVKEVPSLAAAHYYLGVAQVYNQKPWMAKAAFGTAIKLWPQFPAAYMALLKLHMQEQAFFEAIAAGKKVLPVAAEPG